MKRIMFLVALSLAVGCGRPTATPGQDAASGVAQTGAGITATSGAVKR